MGDLGPTTPETNTAGDRRRIYAPSVQQERLWQGEILCELPQARLSLQSISAIANSNAQGSETSQQIQIDYEDHPFAVVLSQDCDLEKDDKRRKDGLAFLYNVLLCDVYYADDLRERLRQEENTGSSDWRVIKENRNARFQFLSGVTVDQDALGTGLPPLAVDFRMYFSIRTDEIYERLKLGLTRKRCRLQTPYAEHLAHRFHSYQSRVPLAREHRA